MNETCNITPSPSTGVLKDSAQKTFSLNGYGWPEELIINIFLELNAIGWVRLSRVSKYYYTISTNPVILASLLERRLYVSVEKTLAWAKNAGPFLTRLDLKGCIFADYQGLQEVFNACPNILQLRLPDTQTTNLSLANVPKNLESLTIGFGQDHDPKGTDFLQWRSAPIPKELKQLERLKHLNFGSNCYYFSTQDVENLPKNLTFLKIPNLVPPKTGMTHLPPNLKSLEFHVYAVQEKGFDNVNLPQLKFLLFQELNKLECLPQNVKFLVLGGDISDEGLTLLPQGLKSLLLQSMDDITDAGLLKLPQTLTSLYLNLSGDHVLTVNAIKNLPPQLKNFFIFGKALNQLVGDAECTFNFTDLPRGLSSLSCVGNELSVENVQCLPEGLKSLRIVFDMNVPQTDWMAHLPSGLQILSIHDFIEDDEEDSLNSMFSDAMFKNLPEKLTALSLYNVKGLSDDLAANLPKGLKYLSIGRPFQVISEVEKLTDAFIDNLPEKLEYLALIGCYKVTDEAVKKLSKRVPDLKHLYLICPNLTLNCLNHLPHDLQNWYLKSRTIERNSFGKSFKSIEYSYLSVPIDGAESNEPVMYINGQGKPKICFKKTAPDETFIDPSE